MISTKVKRLRFFKITSLRPKFLVPIFVFLILCIGLIIGYSRYDYKKNIFSHALIRGQQLGHSIGVCTQITHYPYELQRLVAAFGSEAHIRMIAVLYGDPLSVVACTRSTLVGKVWEMVPLPKGIRLPNFPDQQELYDFIPERYVFNYVLGFYFFKYNEDKTNYIPAYIVIQIDTYFWHKEFLKQNLTMLSVAFFILFLLICICLFQINHWIIQPILAIKRQINKRRLGNLYAMAPVLHQDEIGELSQTLNEMIRSQEKTENLYQKLIDIAPFLLWTTNETNTKFYFNKRWCKFTGQSYLSYDNWSWLQHLTPETAQRYQAVFLKAQKERKSVNFECKLKDYSGKDHWMLCQSVPRILADGHFEGYISCLVDITERKESEKRLSSYAEKLAKARDAALQSVRAKTSFLATMSHEIRTPINGILGFTYLLQDTKLNEEQKDYVKTIMSSTQLLLDLINQILDLSKIEAKKLTLEPSNFHVDTCIKETYDILYPTLVKKGLKLNTWIHPNIEHWLLGDSKRLRQILLNLIGNAIKFTPRGNIFLRVTGKKLDHEAYQLFISVRDQGVGIPPKDVQRIFEAFEQVAYQNKGGTGLGLSITQSLVQLMGGRLKVHSEVNKGSIFFFSIFLKIGTRPPTAIVQEKSNNISYTPTVTVNTNHVLTILLVEDNLENQRVAQKIFEKNGYNVTIVGNGIQCLKWLERNTASLVVMDINMPQMDGFETTRHIRSGMCGFEKASIPILGLTARAMKDSYDRAIAVGMNEILTKPFQPDILLKYTQKLIQKHQK